MTAADLLIKHLEQEGVRFIFGIPGGPIMPLYAALAGSRSIRPVLAKHEEGAAFMADGYARASGSFGVCCTTTGPGATNALTGVAVAYADHIPLLLLTAQVPTRQFGRGAFQESSQEAVDVVSIYRPVTKWSVMVQHPERAAAVIRTALRVMTSGRPGPVHVNLPMDFLGAPSAEDIVPAGRYRFQARTFDRDSVREAAGRLVSAKRPVILAGYGVHLSGAWAALRRLAERLSIPVATTFRAKGVFPEDHQLSLGVFGYSGAPEVREFVLGPETDLLFVAGSSLGEVSTCGWDRRLGRKEALIQLDVEPEAVARNYPVTTALIGDAGAVLTELLYQVERDLKSRDVAEPGLAAGTAGRGALPAASCPGPEPDRKAGCLHPRTLLAELREALPADALVFVDNGTIRTWTGRHFPVCREGTFFVNMGLASMGYAVAASIGGCLARPGRAVAALVGDGAFAMNGMEVHTAVECGAPVVWVVVNNGGLGMIHHGARMQFGGLVPSPLYREPLKAADLGRALGAAAFRVERPGDLRVAVADALSLARPAVIDVAVDLEAVPPMGQRVASLQKELTAEPVAAR
ncbi:MAG: thiamine pyrophosphate-binding protein [Elusimicrobia bacterium]|nr:thiamine pyrophosphate-binding protein [Elusimicrobiota bacterium]